MRVMRAIQDTRADHDWPRNLRELKNYTERLLFLDDAAERSAALPPQPAPAVGDVPPPASLCVPSSDILGRRAKAGEVDHAALITAYVTYVYARTGLNKAEAARLTGFDRRTSSRWIDPVRLARLLGAPNEPTGEARRPPSPDRHARGLPRRS